MEESVGSINSAKKRLRCIFEKTMMFFQKGRNVSGKRPQCFLHLHILLGNSCFRSGYLSYYPFTAGYKRDNLSRDETACECAHCDTGDGCDGGKLQRVLEHSYP